MQVTPHQYQQLQTLINYANMHIWDIIQHREELATTEEKEFKICIVFKQLMGQIRAIAIKCDELDRFNTPMAFLFQHLRDSIIQLMANLSPKWEKLALEALKGLYTLEGNKILYEKLLKLDAKDTMLWMLLQIPYYFGSRGKMLRYRDEYLATLDWLLSKDRLPNFTEAEIIFASNETCLPYAASYHNCNNVLALSKYSQLMRKFCPWLTYFSPTLAKRYFTNSQLQQHKTITYKTPTFPHAFNDDAEMLQYSPLNADFDVPKTQKKKLVFISDSFGTDSSVLRDRVAIVGKLDRELFEVYFASFIPFDAIRGTVAKLFMNRIKDNYIWLGSDISSARIALEPFEFDIIIYPDIGMKLLPTLLAYSRIAPVQVTTWGHSETSGIDTIDYYISSKWFESHLVDSQKHYSEKLVLMESLGTYYISPHLLFVTNNPDYQQGRKRFKTREELGFSSSAHIYCCLQTFYKFNEEFETALARIVELDPKAVILLSNTFPFSRSHLQRILKIFGEAKIAHLRWYGSLEKDEFLNLVAISDVCLDPFPFGGCNTSYEAFDFNVPVITWPSEFLHGRFTYGLYWRMSLENCECIANDCEEYVRLAVDMGINEKLQHKMNRNIEMRKNMIFQEQESVSEWGKVLQQIYTK